MSASSARQYRPNRDIDLLPPEPKAQGRRTIVKREAIDADFVVIAERPRTSNDNRRASGPADGLAGRAEKGLRRLPAGTFAGLVAAAALLVFAATGGLAAMAAAFPAASAAPFSVSGLSTRLEDRNGMRVLAIHGRIANTSGVVQAVPSLDVAIATTGGTLHRRVAPAARALAPGETDLFALRIPHGGGALPEVSVSLAD